MHIEKIIPRRYWHQPKTGFKVSIYGAAPYQTTAEAEGWEMVTRGYTFERSDGTVGALQGLSAGADYPEARQIANQVNLVRRHQLQKHGEFYPEQRAECKRKAVNIRTFI